jgi:hypothetical protein
MERLGAWSGTERVETHSEPLEVGPWGETNARSTVERWPLRERLRPRAGGPC